MFVDYLRVTYLIPWDDAKKSNPDSFLAREYADRALVGKEVKIDGSHHQNFHTYPEGLRCIMDFGGSAIPINLNDFFRRFSRYSSWTISRLDIAENLDHVIRSEVRAGRSSKLHEWFENRLVDEQEVRVWTGSSIGARGKAGSYFRVYDARKHKEGHAGKISRFGTCEFWRVEYELSREWFRRRGVSTFGDLTEEYLQRVWANETNNKGVLIQGTSEYKEVTMRNLPEVEAEIKTENRRKIIIAAANNLDDDGLLKIIGELDNLFLLRSGDKSSLDKIPHNPIVDRVVSLKPKNESEKK